MNMNQSEEECRDEDSKDSANPSPDKAEEQRVWWNRLFGSASERESMSREVASFRRAKEALDGTTNDKEARALIRYVSRSGNIDALPQVNSLNDALAKKSNATTAPEYTAANKDMLIAYTSLSAFTAPKEVTGRTILDSEAGPISRAKLLWFTGALFLIAAITTEILTVILDGQRIDGTEGDSALSILGTVHSAALIYLLPFFWGGLGAFVYLIKTLSDKAADYQFAEDRLQGTFPRLALGAIFGGVLANLFGTQVVEISNQLTIPGGALGTSAIAFLAGLGVRAVYGLFEKIIDSFHSWVQSQGKQPLQSMRIPESFSKSQKAAGLAPQQEKKEQSVKPSPEKDETKEQDPIHDFSNDTETPVSDGDEPASSSVDGDKK